jgi:hypothetical protein
MIPRSGLALVESNSRSANPHKRTKALAILLRLILAPHAADRRSKLAKGAEPRDRSHVWVGHHGSASEPKRAAAIGYAFHHLRAAGHRQQMARLKEDTILLFPLLPWSHDAIAAVVGSYVSQSNRCCHFLALEGRNHSSAD